MTTTATLRTIAKSCGVSASTVSRALSGHPNVKAPLREYVQATAKRIGYTRNQLVGTLMSQVRVSRTQRFVGNLAIVHVPSAEQQQPRPMQKAMVTAATIRARQLGFQLTLHELRSQQLSAFSLGRILRARGVQGVIFLYSRPTDVTNDFPWDYFASVEIDYGSTLLAQHTISLDHHVTLVGALERLRGLGYRRAGLFIERHKDERLMFKWSAAFSSFQNRYGGIGLVPVLMADEIDEATFLRWKRANKLDLVVGHVDKAVAWLRSAGNPVPSMTGFFNLNWNERSLPCAGLDLRPELQGILAVESVVAQIHRNEHGLPDDPHTTMMSGRWVDGPTIHQRS